MPVLSIENSRKEVSKYCNSEYNIPRKWFYRNIQQGRPKYFQEMIEWIKVHVDFEKSTSFIHSQKTAIFYRHPQDRCGQKENGCNRVNQFPKILKSCPN